MACSNFKLINYPAFSKYIDEMTGEDLVNKQMYLYLAQSERFKELCDKNGIKSISSNKRKAFELLRELREEYINSTEYVLDTYNTINSIGFKNTSIRTDAINIFASELSKGYFTSLLNGKDILFEDLYNHVVGNICNEIHKQVLSRLDDNAKNEYKNIAKDCLTRINGKLNLDSRKYAFEMRTFATKIDNDIVKNYCDLLYASLNNNEFINDVVNRKNVANLIHGKGLYQYLDVSELGGYVSTEDYSNNGEDNDDLSVDTMTQLWNLSVGDKSNFEKHVSEIIKYHLSTIPILTTTEQSNGNYAYVRNENFGYAEYMNPTYIQKLLYTKTDISSVDAFIKSIEDIANSIEDAKGLIYLSNYLKKNKDFANKYLSVFNKKIQPKYEVIIKDEALSINQTNTGISTRDSFRSILYNNITSQLATNNIVVSRKNLRGDTELLFHGTFDELLYDLNKNPKSYSNEELFQIINKIIPSITFDSFNKVYDNNLNEAISDIKQLLNLVIDTKQNYKTAIQQYNKTKDYSNLRKSYINSSKTAILYNIVDKFEDYVTLPIILNSRNALGNMSSDVINRSYITNIDDIFGGKFTEEAIVAYANQKFKTNQYEHSNLLIQRKDENGNIINYGLFEKVGNSYTLTDFGRQAFKLSLFNGMNNRDNHSASLYESMTDNDYTMAALAFFKESLKSINFSTSQNVRVGNFFLSVPSDAPKNFTISAPVYNIAGLINDGVVDENHIIFKQFRNIIDGELNNMGRALRVMFEFNADDTVHIDETIGNAKVKDDLDKKKLYKTYFYVGDILTKDTGDLTGNVFKFKRLKSENVKNYFDNLIGRGKLIDFLYGQDVKVDKNGNVILTETQNKTLNERISSFIIDYYNNEFEAFENKYYNLYTKTVVDENGNNQIKPTISDDLIRSFLINDFLVRDATFELFGGDQSFYKNSQEILKRLKQIQGSGEAYGNVNFTETDLTPRKEGDEIKFGESPITINGRTIKRQNKFTGVTIANSERTSRPSSLANIKEQLKQVKGANVNRLLAPFKEEETSGNDAQSYITFDEWIRRMDALGELGKYKDLIEALTNDTPLEEIDWNNIKERIQIQKNFYFDLHFDAYTNTEVPRQIKNAEFVLVPKLIKGTQLENLYNTMIKHGIDVIHTVDTTKVAQHNVMTYWNADGVVTKKAEKDFDNNVENYKEEFSYNYLYRQQEVPQHLVDEENKVAVQITKKLLDNLPENLQPVADKILENISLNVKEAYDNVCNELGIKFDENGNIAEMNMTALYSILRKNAAQQGLDKSLLEFFEVNEAGFPKFDIRFSNSISKLENVINGYINRNIVRQTISGFHAAQLSDYGFTNEGVKSDSSLQYKKKGTFNGMPVYEVEIAVPRYSKVFEGKNIEDLTDEQKTLIGYRIPTEGKQSIAIFKIKRFLPDAYGSTIVVPPEWVTQTGSDFDVDSIYTITQNFIKTDNGIVKYDYNRYNKKDKEAYINYLYDNFSNIVRGIFEKNITPDKNAELLRLNIADKFKDVIRVIRNTDDESYINSLAKDNNFITFEEFKNKPVSELNCKEARDNAIFDGIIELLSNPATYEESATTSNFKNITEVAKKEEKKFNTSPSTWLTQSRWQNDATSGIKIKGIAVNLNTFGSIANKVKAYHDVGIKVSYDASEYKLKELKDRFGENNVDVVNDEDVVYDREVVSPDINDEFKYFSSAAAKNISFSDLAISICTDFSSYGEKTVRNLCIDERNKGNVKYLPVQMFDRQNDELIEDAIVRHIVDGIVEKGLAGKPLKLYISGNDISVLAKSGFKQHGQGGLSNLLFNVINKLQTDNKVSEILNGRNVSIAEIISDGRNGIGQAIISAGYAYNKINKNKIKLTVNTFTTNKAIIVKNDVNYQEFEKNAIKGKPKYIYNRKSLQSSRRRYVVTHKNIGWSNDNRGIDGYLINPYASQITAHILDVMKSGPIHNENTYTVFALYALVGMGGNYDTIIKLFNHPAVEKIVSNWKDNQSVTKEYSNPITKSLYDYLVSINGSYLDNPNMTRRSIISRLEKEIGDAYERKYGYTLKESFSGKIPLTIDLSKSSNNSFEKLLDNLHTIALFNSLLNIGQDINKNYNAIRSDGYGAAKTFRETYDIINNRNDAKNIYCPGDISIVDAVLKGNKYSSLKAFYNYGTKFSLKIGDNFSVITSKNFINYVNRLKEHFNGFDLDVHFSNFTKQIINKDIIENPYICLPVTIEVNSKDVAVAKDSVGLDVYDAARKGELMRMVGINLKYENESDVRIDNYNELSNEEKQKVLDEFAKLSPAQKILALRNQLGIKGIFDHIEVNLNDNRYDSSYSNFHRLYSKESTLGLDELHNLFREAYLNKNELIRLTAIDLVKYSYLVEQNKFNLRNISKLKDNSCLESIEVGGLDISSFVENNNSDYLFKDKNVEDFRENRFINDFITYCRTNYDSVPVNSVDLKKIRKYLKGYTVVTKEDGRIIFEQTGEDNYLIDTFGENYNIVRSENNVLYFVVTDDLITLYPLNKLLSFETANPYNNSVISKNNIYTPLYEMLYNNYEELKQNDTDFNYIESDIKAAYSKGVLDMELSIINDPDFDIKDTNVFLKKVANSQTDRIYRRINKYNQEEWWFTTDKNLEGNKLSEEYNISDKNLISFIKVNPSIVTSERTMFSRVVDETPIGTAYKTIAEQVAADQRSGKEEARRVLYGLRMNGIDIVDANSFENNIQYSTHQLINYVLAECNDILEKINKFSKIGNDYVSIDDDRIIEKVLNDFNYQDEFLKTIATARTIRDKYEPILTAPIDDLDDQAKNNILRIRNKILEVANSDKVLTARNKWLKQWVMKNSNNPNIDLGIMGELDSYSDTSFLDYWIQDLRANKNLLIQVLTKEIGAKVEEGRINGELAANDFIKKVKEIEAQAKAAGMTATIDSVVDKDGKLIQPNTEEYLDKKQELIDAVKVTEQVHGRTSKEYYIAKNNLDLFRGIYEVSRFKEADIPVYNAANPADKSMKVRNTYNRFVANLEYNYLHNTQLPGLSDALVKYKNILYEMSKILNQAVNNVLTDEQQRQIDGLYKQMDELTFVQKIDPVTGAIVSKSGEEMQIALALNEYIINVNNAKKVFFAKEVNDTFDTLLKENLAVIKRYEKRDAFGNLISNRSELMKIDEYKNALDWIRRNTLYTPNQQDTAIVERALSVLNDSRSYYSSIPSTYTKYANSYKDGYGIIDGIRFSKDHPELIKNIKLEQESRFKKHTSNGMPYAGILRNKSEEKVIYINDFYDRLISVPKSENVIKALSDIGEDINAILREQRNPFTGRLNVSQIPIEDLRKLRNYFDKYADVGKTKSSKEVAEFIKEQCVVEYDEETFEEDKELARRKGDDYYREWLATFTEEDFDGTIVPRKALYSTIKPKNEDSYINKEATEALRQLDDYMTTEETQYYQQEKERMLRTYGKDSNEYKEWFTNNHYYDAYTGEFKPISIWTNSTVKNISPNGQEKYSPRINQMVSAIKPELENEEYNSRSGVSTYNINNNSKKYNNPEYENLNEYQKELINLIKDTMRKYIFSNNDAKFVDEGYLPTIRKADPITAEKFVKESFGIAGFSTNIPSNLATETTEDIVWQKDAELDNMLYHRIVSKTNRKRIEIPEKLDSETNEQYEAKVKGIREENKKIDEENRKAHADLLNRNWEEVFKNLIVTGERYNNIRTAKSLLYTIDQIVNDNASRKKTSKGDFKDAANTNTSKAIRNYIKRLVLNKYKDDGDKTWIKLGTLAQSIAGTKYMAMNITGGIANVITGSNNIMMERFAGDYTTFKSWEKAKALWIASTPNFMADLYKTSSSSLTNAIIKLANVVDFDRLTEINNTEGIRLSIQRARNLMFSPQNMGEHYMQNTMLLSMMLDHKVMFDENTGTYRIFSKKQYRRNADKIAMLNVIKDNEELLSKWNEFIKAINSDEKLAYEYNTFRHNPIQDFIKFNFNRELVEKYKQEKKRLIKEKDKEFDESKTNLYDQFDLVNGYANIKPDSNLTIKEFSRFTDKVREVNKKIHGVYDKLGAANLEFEWFGGMVMQYHKHLYPGFKKRYRWNGYYNETLDTVEKGAYKSFWEFLTMPFSDARRKMPEDTKLLTLEGIQNYCKELLNVYGYITQWNLLPDYDKANVRRTLADMLYVGAAIVGAIAVSGLMGDDDDDFIYNLLLYQADRMATESAAFTPYGAYAEFNVQYSSPIAFGTSIKDALSTMNYAVRTVLDENYVSEFKTGKYAKQDKLKTYVTRNIPVVRGINNLILLPKNNKYYKLNKNALSVVPYGDIASELFNK